MITIEQIKEECRQIIALAEKATPGKWKSVKSIHGNQYRCVEIDRSEGYTTLELKPEDADFIAASRSFTPKAARAVLITIEALEKVKTCYGHQTAGHQICVDELETICLEWGYLK